MRFRTRGHERPGREPLGPELTAASPFGPGSRGLESEGSVRSKDNRQRTEVGSRRRCPRCGNRRRR